ncbi:hypothetical protein B0H14DRAFT_2641998 [Mycena olivaceomarginata]|nr:hypothetical protein B0H14DRAFT_2641998 [Mycena olivaceomarginata]
MLIRRVDSRKLGLSVKPHKPAGLHVGLSASHFGFLADAKPAKWLAKPTKWLASQKAGRGRVMPPKSTPTPETSHSVRAQAAFASQKLKDTSEHYAFVAKFSGSGWDDDEKHATNTDEIHCRLHKGLHWKQDIRPTAKNYAKCFKRPCPYYEKLSIIYHGMKNKATGEHVVHLASKKTRKSRKKRKNGENTDSHHAGPSTAPSDAPTAGTDDRLLLGALNVDGNTAGNEEVDGLASSREAVKPKPRLDKPSQAKSTASGGLGLGLGVAEAQAKGSSRGLEGAK